LIKVGKLLDIPDVYANYAQSRETNIQQKLALLCATVKNIMVNGTPRMLVHLHYYATISYQNKSENGSITWCFLVQRISCKVEKTNILH